MRTTPGRAPADAAAAPSDPTAWLDVLLGDYPHIARCPSCRRYVLEWTDLPEGLDLITIALAYHESSHTFDPLTVASEHFAAPS